VCVEGLGVYNVDIGVFLLVSLWLRYNWVLDETSPKQKARKAEVRGRFGEEDGRWRKAREGKETDLWENQ
jgi:hypothetical protein